MNATLEYVAEVERLIKEQQVYETPRDHIILNFCTLVRDLVKKLAVAECALETLKDAALFCKASSHPSGLSDECVLDECNEALSKIRGEK